MGVKLKKNILKKIVSNPEIVWGVILIACFTLYSSLYVPHVIMPQQGWWQYYASRILQGDVLYKDIYLYMPPYYVFFVCIFYPLFKSHFFLYTILVGYPIKVLCILIIYKVIGKMVRPVYAAISVFAGAIISSTYFMDVWFDYNPILMLFCVLLAYCIMKYYEKRAEQKKRLIYSLCTGLLCGILLGSKQTLGIAFAVLSLVMLGILHIKERLPKTVWTFVSFFLGFIAGLLPACIYFVYNDCWSDFWRCLNIATGAKGGISGLVDHLIAVLSYKGIWVITLAAFALMLLTEKKAWIASKLKWDQKYINIVRFSLVCGMLFCAGYVFNPHFSGLLTMIREASLEIYVLVIAVCVFFWARLGKERPTLEARQTAGIVLVLLAAAMLVCTRLSENTLRYLYDGLGLFDMRRKLIVVLSYLFILFWLQEMFRYFIQRERDDYCLLMFWSVMAMHFFVSVISAAVLEEIFMVLYVPLSLAVLFRYRCSGEQFKNGILIGCILVMTILSLICKLYIPYDWQGWRVSPISSEDVYCDVDGLEGLKVSRDNNKAYMEIVNLILEETEEDDTVYSFANTALFNVLTGRKSPTYAPIAWFDVCPDSIAESDAELLAADPPKIIVWQNMDDGQWSLLESVFRNGEPSGQRALKEFYDTFVKNNYTLVVEIDNHRDGTLQAWKRNETYYKQDELSEMFGGGSGTSDDPFIVRTADQLEQVRDMVNKGYSFKNQYIAQTSDIDLSEAQNWVPIGEYSSDNQFSGTYDGRGHVIKNMNCRLSDNIGLFGRLAGTVCNLGVVDGYANGQCVGVISSHAYSDSAKIINCYTACTVEGIRAGGIADNFVGSIINCISYSQCKGEEIAGAVSYFSGYVQNVWADHALVSSSIPDSYGHGEVRYTDSNYLTSETMRQIMNDEIARIDFEIKLVPWDFAKDGRLVLKADDG